MDIQKKLEEMGAAFESFKKTNDQRLEEIKKSGVASAATEEKLAKTEKHISDLEAKISEMNAALARQSSNQDPEQVQKEEMKKYKSALFAYMRKNEEMPKELKEMAAKSMSVESDADGGFLVTPEMSAEITKKVFESSPIRQLASVQTITSDSFELLHDLDEVGSGWVGETEARPGTTTPKLKKEIIPVHELYAFPFATQKLLDDAGVNLEAWLAEKTQDKFSRDEATAFVSGNGVNKPKGILAYGAGDGFGLIQRKETAANNALTADELIDVQSLLKEAYQINASWLINRLMIATIRKYKDVNTGQYIWQPGLTAGSPNQLLGKPVYMANDLPSAITANTDTIIYGDIKAGYQIVDRIGIRVLRDAYTAKPYVGFYTTKRVGGAVKNFEAVKVLKVKA